jgi:nucleoside-diphosphate-sugar epimerase
MFGVIHCLEYARKRTVKGMIFLSSSVVYGKDVRGPFKENFIGTVDYANDPYSASKISGETLCRAYYREYDVPAKIVRLFQVYDNEEGDRGTFLADCLKSCKEDIPIIIRSNGKNTRNLIHSEDAASAILFILFRGNAGETYNVGSRDGNYSFFEIAKIMTELFGRGSTKQNIVVEGKNDGSSDYQVPDITKLLELGWTESKGTLFQELVKMLN